MAYSTTVSQYNLDVLLAYSAKVSQVILAHKCMLFAHSNKTITLFVLLFYYPEPLCWAKTNNVRVPILHVETRCSSILSSTCPEHLSARANRARA